MDRDIFNVLFLILEFGDEDERNLAQVTQDHFFDGEGKCDWAILCFMKNERGVHENCLMK